MVMTDASGAVAERYAYTPYGERTVMSPANDVLAESAVRNEVGFSGRYFDAETALWYYRARQMSSTLGRFVGRDHAEGMTPSSLSGYADAWSLYMYAKSDPFNQSDPMGLKVSGVGCGDGEDDGIDYGLGEPPPNLKPDPARADDDAPLSGGPGSSGDSDSGTGPGPTTEYEPPPPQGPDPIHTAPTQGKSGGGGGQDCPKGEVRNKRGKCVKIQKNYCGKEGVDDACFTVCMDEVGWKVADCWRRCDRWYPDDERRRELCGEFCIDLLDDGTEDCCERCTVRV